MSNSLTSEQRAEITMLADELGKAYGRKVAELQKVYRAFPDDGSVQKMYGNDKGHSTAMEPISDEDMERRLEYAGLKGVTWADLQALANNDHTKMLELWEKVKSNAHSYVAGGQFGGDALTGDAEPFDRAIFIAVRNRFVEGWQPRDAIEMAMVEMLAQSYLSWHFWLKLANTMWSRQNYAADKIAEEEVWKTPRQQIADVLDHAFMMSDRFNRMFLRIVRQMRDLRRYTQPVVVQNAGQVNIAADGGQQVNVQKKGRHKKAQAKRAPRRLRMVDEKKGKGLNISSRTVEPQD